MKKLLLAPLVTLLKRFPTGRYTLRYYLSMSLLAASSFYPMMALSGQTGVMLDKTRIVYHHDTQYNNISLYNRATDNHYIIQPWIEDAKGKKTTDFIVSPPQFKSEAGKDNLMRVIATQLPKHNDKEQLYYFNVRVVPSVNKADLESKNMLLATITKRIKLFVRPNRLPLSFDEAVNQLTFSRNNNKVTINNPTPYYLTLTDIKLGNQSLGDIMVPPRECSFLSVPSANSDCVTFHVINDFGGLIAHKRTLLS